jgi:ATP/maltotriose-dependent transcriptional regulator MalT
MLLAELKRYEPELIPVLRRRAAGWCLANGGPEEALEYSMAVGDVDTAAHLAEKLPVSAHRQGRVTTIRRWFRWLEGPGRDGVSVGEQAGAHEDRAIALCQRSLLAIAHREWDRAETFAGQARAALRQAGIEESYATPLVSAVHARTAIHRGDLPAARQVLNSAQRLRHLLTYALPYFAVQARIELTRVHLALADLAGARTLMRDR